MIRRGCCLGLVLLLSACGGAPWRALPEWLEVRQLIGRADGLARDGDHAGARTLYQQLIRELPSGPWTARALFRLARLQVTPDSPIRDYQQAYHHFDRLLVEYPESPEAGEARAWLETLGQLLALEDESRLNRQVLERLRQSEIQREENTVRVRRELERLKKRAADLAREAARARQDLERLKKIDLELEKKQP